jgi:hypothetical protein
MFISDKDDVDTKVSKRFWLLMIFFWPSWIALFSAGGLKDQCIKMYPKEQQASIQANEVRKSNGKSERFEYCTLRPIFGKNYAGEDMKLNLR